jgi:hypothetical protein
MPRGAHRADQAVCGLLEAEAAATSIFRSLSSFLTRLNPAHTACTAQKIQIMAFDPNVDIQKGYRGLAGFIGPQLHEGVGIFKRFKNLNTLNLLYMQAELMHLEQELKVLALIDTGHPNHQTFATSVRDMKQSPDSPQWRKVLEVRNMLKTYSTQNVVPIVL